MHDNNKDILLYLITPAESRIMWLDDQSIVIYDMDFDRKSLDTAAWLIILL